MAGASAFAVIGYLFGAPGALGAAGAPGAPGALGAAGAPGAGAEAGASAVMSAPQPGQVSGKGMPAITGMTLPHSGHSFGPADTSAGLKHIGTSPLESTRFADMG